MEHVQRNLPAILKWSLQQQTEDPSPQQPIDPERRQWLDEAMHTIMSQPTETDLLKAALTVLRVHSDKETWSVDEKEKLLQSFEHVEYFVEDLDHASDLVPLNGVEVVNKYLNCSDSSLQEKACKVIACACQNYHRCQDAFLNVCLSPLLIILNTPRQNTSLRINALSAISSLIRGHSEAIELFVHNEGISSLISCLQSDSPKLIIKTCFLLQSLYTEPHDKLRLVSGHVTATLIHLLSTNTDNQVIERVIGGLCQILEQCRDIALPIWVDQGVPAVEENLLQMFSFIEDEDTRQQLKELIGLRT